MDEERTVADFRRDLKEAEAELQGRLTGFILGAAGKSRHVQMSEVEAFLQSPAYREAHDKMGRAYVIYVLATLAAQGLLIPKDGGDVLPFVTRDGAETTGDDEDE